MEENEIKLEPLDKNDSKAIARYAVEVLDSKKAHGLKLLHVENRTVIADYFVLCTGTSRTQIKALADELEYKLGLRGIQIDHTEGLDTGWQLLDFGSVIVHIFNTEFREFYKLDKLYADSVEEDITDIITKD